jgi:hypothetical protein
MTRANTSRTGPGVREESASLLHGLRPTLFPIRPARCQSIRDLVSVDVNLWSAVLDARPAHVIHAGCDCEEDMGSPYLLAWRDGDEFLLRELTTDDAYDLQHLCMRARMTADVLERQHQCDSSTTAQSRLF